jgi:hypothetical protein
MGYVSCGAKETCSLIGLCVAQVSLKVNRLVEGHLHGTCCLTDCLKGQMLSCLLHVDVVLCFCGVHVCSEWRIQQITDCPHVNAYGSEYIRKNN